MKKLLTKALVSSSSAAKTIACEARTANKTEHNMFGVLAWFGFCKWSLLSTVIFFITRYVLTWTTCAKLTCQMLGLPIMKSKPGSQVFFQEAFWSPSRYFNVCKDCIDQWGVLPITGYTRGPRSKCDSFSGWRYRKDINQFHELKGGNL